MNQRRANLLLWAAAGICTVGAIVAIALGVLLPLQSATAELPKSATAVRKPATTQAALSLADFQPIFVAVERPADAVATSPEAIVAAATPTHVAAENDRPPLTLIGTIGHSLALLRNDRGDVEIKAVGETAAGARIVSIRKSRVEIEHNGRSIVLEKLKDANAGS